MVVYQSDFGVMFVELFFKVFGWMYVGYWEICNLCMVVNICDVFGLYFGS